MEVPKTGNREKTKKPALLSNKT